MAMADSIDDAVCVRKSDDRKCVVWVRVYVFERRVCWQGMRIGDMHGTSGPCAARLLSPASMCRYQEKTEQYRDP